MPAPPRTTATPTSPSYQLYDTTGGTEDWAFWTAGTIGFTPEIGDENFHPAFERAVVGEYLGLGTAAGAGQGGNSAAYREMQRATADPAYHSTIVGTAPSGWSLEVSKQFLTSTSPVIGRGGEVIQFEDSLSSRYDSRGGKFSFAVNPSTRPIVAGRDGRDPTGPPQAGVTLANPAGVPAENPDLDPSKAQETTTFTIEEGFDNAFADLRLSWADGAATDWDFYVFDDEGNEVGSAATGDQPEVLSLADPVPGTYTVMAFNYDGGSLNDWSGTVGFRGPTPRVVNEPEAWVLTCTDRRGKVRSVEQVVVARGETVDVGNVCSPRSRARD